MKISFVCYGAIAEGEQLRIKLTKIVMVFVLLTVLYKTAITLRM